VPNGQVDAVLALGTRFYIGGAFTEVSGRSRAGLAAFDIATGELDPGFSPSTNGNVYNISTDGNRLFVAGHFTEISRSFNNSVASIDPLTGEASQDFRLFLDKDAYTLAILGQKLYIGGEFTKVNEQPRNRMAAVDLVTGAVDAAFNPDPDNDVYGLALSGGRLVAGGKFTSAPRTPALHLAAIDAATGATSAGFAAGTDAPVRALAVAGNRLFAGGDFKVANGAARARLAAFDATTGALNRLDVRFDGGIGVLAVGGGRLYAGGFFEKAGGRLHPAVAAIDLASDTLVKAFNAPPDRRHAKLRFQTIDALVPLGKRVLAGGDLNVSRTLKRGKRKVFQYRSGLVALRGGDGTIDFSFNAHTSGGVQALALSGKTLYVAGTMSRRSGTKIVPRRSKIKGRKLKPRKVPIYRYNLVALEAASGDLVRAFAPRVNGSVDALAQAGDRLYIAGGFETVGGRRRDGFAAVSTARGVASTTFSPQPVPAESTISALLTDGGRVFAAGRFAGFGGIARAHFAAFAADATGGAA
jgi:hypothetical protein